MTLQYKKSDDPYLLSDEEFTKIKESHHFWGGFFLSKIIPIKGQTWFTSETLKKVTAIIHYKDESWALRVTYEGDPYSGHIGMAYCPFVSAVNVTVRNKAGESVVICPAYIHPIPHEGGWIWRVEYRRANAEEL